MTKNFPESGTLLDSSVPFIKSCSALLNRAVERPSSLSQSQAEQAWKKLLF